MKTTTAITKVKRDVQLHEWTEQIKAQQESGMTVAAYRQERCIEGIHHRSEQIPRYIYVFEA